MSLTDRWIDFIYRVATGNWRTRLIIAPIAWLFYVSMILVIVFLALFVDRALDLPDLFIYPWGLAAGILLILSGGIVLFVSIAYFINYMGTPVPFCPPPELVTNGPYRFVRNPMQAGLFIQFFGLGVAIGSLALILFFTPIFIALNVWEIKNVEEPELVRRLGEEYMEYRRRTPMFLPFRIRR